MAAKFVLTQRAEDDLDELVEFIAIDRHAPEAAYVCMIKFWPNLNFSLTIRFQAEKEANLQLISVHFRWVIT